MELLGKLNRNSKIQRYMDLSKFIDLLENNRLFMCRMDYFEDKLEGGTTTINDFIFGGAAQALSNLVNKSLPQGSLKNASHEQHDKLNNCDEVNDSLSFPTVFGDITITDDRNYKNILSDQKKWLDVSCWHLNTDSTENMAMWKIYGGGTNSVCITTSVGELLDNMDINSLNLIVSNVNYINHHLEYYNMEHPIDPFIHKHKAYKFENEIRFIVYDQIKDISTERVSKGSIIKLKSLGFIDEVKVSPEAPEWFFDLISSVFNKRYGLNGKVVRSDLNDLISNFGT